MDSKQSDGSAFPRLGTYSVTEAQRESFKNGALWPQWLETYPFLFDEDNERLVKRNASRGYYFYEWLAAIILFHNYGAYSLVDHYQYGRNKHMNAIFHELAGEVLVELVKNSRKNCPDLLVYLPDKSDWCFVEVKGPGDRLEEQQMAWFKEIRQVARKPICLVRFTLVRA